MNERVPVAKLMRIIVYLAPNYSTNKNIRKMYMLIA